MGQGVCFGLSRPDPGSNAQDQDGIRTGWDGPRLWTWMGPKRCKTKHMANLDGTPSDPGWDLDGPSIGPRRGSGWHPQRQLGLYEIRIAANRKPRFKTSVVRVEYRSIQIDYRQIFSWGEINFQVQIQNRATRRTELLLQRQICGNVSRKSLITDTDSLLNPN